MYVDGLAGVDSSSLQEANFGDGQRPRKDKGMEIGEVL
jgi:hypothetical protein